MDPPLAPAPHHDGRAFPNVAEALPMAVVVACIVAPIIVGRDVLFPFVVPRAVFMRTLLGIGLAALLTLAFTRRYHLQDTRDPILAGLAVFLLLTGLSSLLGTSPLRSLFGEMERMWGLVTWFYLVVLYGLVRTLPIAHWRALLRLSIGVGLLVVGLAMLQRMPHLVPATVTGANRSTVYSTLGNPSYLSAYLMFHIGFSALLAMRARTWMHRGAYLGSLLVGLFGLTLGGGRTALIGAAVGVAAAFTVLLWLAPAIRKAIGSPRALIAIASTFVLVLMVLVSPAGQANPMVRRLAGLSLDDSTFATRFLAWEVAWQAFRDRPFLGFGYENFQVAYARFYPPGVDAFMDGAVWDRAHNLYLDLLATTGVLGLLAYLAIWVAYFWSVRAAFRAGRATAGEAAVLTGMGVAYLVYLLMWFEDHASTISLIVLFAYVSTLRSGGPLATFGAPLDRQGGRRALVAVAVAVIALFTWQHAVQVYRSARLVVEARSAETVEDRLEVFHRALDSSGSVGLVVVGLYTDYLRSFTPQVAEIRAHPERAAVLRSGVSRGLTEVDRAIAVDPQNDVWWIDQSRLLALAAELTGERRYHRASIESLEEAIRLSPTQPRLYHLLSELHLVAGDVDSALVALGRATERTGDLPRTHYFVSRAYRAGGDLSRSRAALEQALRGGEIQREQLEWHVAQLERGRAEAPMVPLLLAYWEGRRSADTGLIHGVTLKDFELISRLPLIALRAGAVEEAERSAAAVAVEYRPAADLVERFVTDIRRGHGAAWTPYRSLADAARSFGGLQNPDRLRR